MKKILSILLLILAIICFIWATEVDLALFSISIMSIGSGITIWKTIAYTLAGVILLIIRKKIYKL
ncbi:hypothetical protein N8383_02110 [Flavobacteriaceae bacterium]|nr:hypothetical protein [Flavobacteriaceae bacterium]MDC1535030.1 hypothetical protein [Flavobacteriaceae bacterium]